MAECHPIGFQWVMEAKKRGATVIHVDPRFTRTSAVADVYVPIRAGTDIAFLGGIIRYVMENEKYFLEYVKEFTNASALLRPDFQDTEDLAGIFSGWDPEKCQYDPTSWQYQGDEVSPAAAHRETFTTEAWGEKGTHNQASEHDPTLQSPRCVFQVLRRHFARYTPEMVEDICGIPKAQLLTVAETLCRNSGRERTSAFVYSVGWTQHSVGVQYIRTAAILQLLLGNVGRTGGGVLALRGHASIQGSTDIPTLYNLLPGYLPMMKASDDLSFDEYLRRNQAPTGWWSGVPEVRSFTDARVVW